MKKDRQSNIELLRIIAIIGVVVLHYNNPVFGGGLRHANEGSTNFYILYILESFFACAVNLFILISGYFMCESKKRSIWRPIELIVQVILFQIIVYITQTALGYSGFSANTLLNKLLPSNYFVILYCAVYLVSPWINVLIGKLSEKSFRKLIIMAMILFSLYPTAVDVLGELRGEQIIGLSSVGAYGSQWGYSFVNLLLLYLTGAYLKRKKTGLMTWNTGKLAVCLLINTLLITIWARMNDKTGYLTERSAWEYCNPLIILQAVLLLAIFSKINLGSNKIINKLAEGVFTVFLVHQFFLRYLSVKQFVTGNTALMIFHIFCSSIAIFFACWLVYMIYHLSVGRIFKLLSAKIKIPMIDAEESRAE